jgi:hypothetical protein
MVLAAVRKTPDLVRKLLPICLNITNEALRRDKIWSAPLEPQ